MSLFDALPTGPGAGRGPKAGAGAGDAGGADAVPVRTVSQLLEDVKATLAEAYPEVWVRGEISGFHHHASGHMYFSLKDAGGTLSCAWFKFQQRGLRFTPKDGVEVEARGIPDIYAPRGAFQLRVLELRPAGAGALLLAFEALKKKLAAEGLFAPARKRPLPQYPQAVGLVTSPAGAAVRDLLHVLRRRWPGLRIVLAPVPVQGEGAAAAIARAIARLNELGGLDVLIVGRGGGSLEDLWAFNEEAVVRAVAGSRIPVVSAVGHEVDFTLCDFAADVRAATPSAAAELVTTPDRATVRRRLRDARTALADAIEDRIGSSRERLAALRRTYGFRRPGDLLARIAQRRDELTLRLARAGAAGVRHLAATVHALDGRLHPGRLFDRVAALVRARAGLSQRLAVARQAQFDARSRRLATAQARLAALSPRAVLARGYSLVTRADGTVVRSAAQVTPGETLGLEFGAGRARTRVLDVETPPRTGEER